METREQKIENALVKILIMITEGEFDNAINPFCYPEIKEGLKALAENVNCNWLDVLNKYK